MEDRFLKSYNRYKNKFDPSSLISIQLDSYQELKDKGIQQVFRDISQIRSKDGHYTIHLPDGSAFAKNHKLSWRLDPPEYPVQECVEKGLTYSCSLMNVSDTKLILEIYRIISGIGSSRKEQSIDQFKVQLIAQLRKNGCKILIVDENNRLYLLKMLITSSRRLQL